MNPRQTVSNDAEVASCFPQIPTYLLLQQYQGLGRATQYNQPMQQNQDAQGGATNLCWPPPSCAGGRDDRSQPNAAPSHNRQQQYDDLSNQGGVTSACWPNNTGGYPCGPGKSANANSQPQQLHDDSGNQGGVTNACYLYNNYPGPCGPGKSAPANTQQQQQSDQMSRRY